MQEISFQDLPQKYIDVLNEIFNEDGKKKNTLKKLYSKFSFKCLNFTLACENADKEIVVNSLFTQLFRFNFMTYFFYNKESYIS